MDELRHPSAMVKEVLEALGVHPGGWWADGTADGGGHTLAIAEATAPDGRIIAFDADPSMLPLLEQRLWEHRDRVTIVHGYISQTDKIVAGVTAEKLDGFLADLGPSRIQLLSPERGFSMSSEARLDARYDRTHQRLSAWDVVNRYSRDKLFEVLRITGQPRQAGVIADAIVRAREAGSIDTPAELAEIIRRALGRRARRGGADPATKWLMSIRMAVNRELEEAEEGIEAAVRALRSGGRLAVLSWDGTTHRVVRNKLRELARGCVCPPEVPCTCGRKPVIRLIHGNGVAASEEERRVNPATRTCRLFAAEKL